MFSVLLPHWNALHLNQKGQAMFCFEVVCHDMASLKLLQLKNKEVSLRKFISNKSGSVSYCGGFGLQ